MMIPISKGLGGEYLLIGMNQQHSNWVMWDMPKRQEQTELLAGKRAHDFFLKSANQLLSGDFFKSAAISGDSKFGVWNQESTVKVSRVDRYAFFARFFP